MTHCVYRHIRPDTNEVFYVGMGTKKRPYTNTNRNRYWNNIVKLNSGKFKVDILLDELSIEEAERKEQEFIAIYGRVVDKTGTLVNLHLGGDNHSGFNMAETTKAKMSEAHKGNSATKDYIRITNGTQIKAIHNSIPIPEGWWRGEPKRKPASEEFKRNASLRMKGKPMPFTKEQRQAWTKGNKGSSGHFWITDGVNSTFHKVELEIPEGWRKGHNIKKGIKK